MDMAMRPRRQRQPRALTAALAACGLLVAASVSAQDSAPLPVDEAATAFVFEGSFVTLGHVRSDSDFDPTPRFYDLDGQTEGQIATFFRPTIGVDAGAFQLRYEAELGWNVWSRNSTAAPNQFFPGGDDGLTLRHRQLWASYSWSDEVALTVGYQHLADPSRLFLDHHAGGARFDFAWLGMRSAIWVGQLPDSTLEGVPLNGDNFLTDSFVLGVDNTWSCSGLTIDANLYGLVDMRVVDQPLNLVTAVAGVRWRGETLALDAHLLGQLGVWEGSGVGGVDQTVAAWAAQATMRHQVGDLDWSVGALVLSGDDDHRGNGTINAFIGSGKNASPSTWLTEDEVRDRYDNLDERIATSWGAFFIHHAGLALFDVSAGYALTDWYTPRLVVATGLALSADHALGETFVGAELGLHNRFRLGDHARLVFNLQLLVPGGATAAFVNDVDRRATEAAFGGQLGFLASF
jgi:hypothetical protein